MFEAIPSVNDWLLSGDVAIRFQAMRDLLGESDPTLQSRIAKEGWGARYLACRNPDGGWGQAFYRPKWTSTHYTLLDLRNLEIAPDTAGLLDVVQAIADQNISMDGGIGTSPGLRKSDVCVNGMFLNYACYFGIPERAITSVIDFLLSETMADGGFNCMSNRSGAHHGSLHSTLSVLEGLHSFQSAGIRYRGGEVEQAIASAQEFILLHRLFRSDRTGEVINPDFLKMPYPPRWRYNVLRALDYFRLAGVPYDPRMGDALTAVLARRRADGTWPRQAALPGKVHFVMEPARGPGRWNTLIALRVLMRYRRDLVA